MAEITFLAPGSCQLEVTAQGDVGTDTGVDLASVSWTIEQALIAGCRFSPSAGDVHIDRNGVLTIGRSLFDRINQSDGDDAIPGQCTLIIRADSTITDNVLDRFKVLVGYPGEGGGGGGGGDVGNLVAVYAQSDVPVANQNVGADFNEVINTVSLTSYANPTVVASNVSSVIAMAASGTFVRTPDGTPFVEEHPACYDVVVDDNTGVFTSVAQLEDVNINATPNIQGSGSGFIYEIKVPALEFGHSLIVVSEILL